MQDDIPPKGGVNLPAEMRKLPAHDNLRDAGVRDDPSSALTIYQAFLDRLCAANCSGDFKAWTNLSEYPHTVHAESFDKIIQHGEEARPFFDMVSDMLSELSVDQLLRVADHAEFIDPSMIMGHHMAYFRSNGKDMVTPMASRMVIRKTTGEWRMISVTNAITNESFPYARPEPADGLPPHLNVVTRMREAALTLETEHACDAQTQRPRDALEIYRTFCEALSNCTMTGDLKGWLKLAHFPHWAHFIDANHVIETPEDETRVFASFQRILQTHDADTQLRDVQSARFISTDEIVGHHVFHMRKDGVELVPPVKSRMVIRHISGRWRKVSVTNDVEAPVWPAKSFVDVTRQDGTQHLRAIAGPRSMDDAMAIYRTFLDAFTRSNETGVPRNFIGTFDVPFYLDLGNSEHILQTREALVEYFDMLKVMFQKLNLDRMERTPVSAEFLSSDMLSGRHVIRFLRNGRDVLDALDSSFVLRRGADDNWRIVSARNATAQAEVKLHARMSALHAKAQNLTLPDDSDAMAIYQAQLDQVSAYQTSGDFDGFSKHFALPMAYHADNLDVMITTQNLQRSFFDVTTHMMTQHNADNVVRMAVGAELTDPDMLSGHHMTCLQRDGRDVFPPLSSHWIMRRNHDGWRAVTVVNGLRNDTFPLSEWLPSDGVLPGLNIKKRTET